MPTCGECGFRAKSAGGLRSHERSKHRGRNLEAAERTIRALRDLGRFEASDEARVTAVLSLARAVDADPANAALWREYRLSIREVLSDDEDANRELQRALDEIRSAPVGDAPAR